MSALRSDLPRVQQRDGIPYRLISRRGNEMCLSGVSDLARLVPRPFDRGVVLLLLLRQCLPDWTAGGRLERPQGLTRFYSINGLAASLGRPFETVRRHVHALMDQGLCVADPRGVAIANDPASAALILPYLTRAHDVLIRLIEDIAPAEILPAATRPPAADLVAATTATALDIHLLPLESFGTTVGGWTSALLWLGVAVANVRHIVEDPALDRLFAVDSTPDALRRPASIDAIADLMQIPRATAWRHRKRLEAAQLLARKQDGWIIRTDQLHDPRIAAGVNQGVHYTLRRIGDLVAQGLDRHDAASHYLERRAEYVAL